MNKFYVYGYKRSKDSNTCHAKAGSFYYIGKGSGKRAYSKRRSCRIPSDISNIVIIQSNLSEKEAFELEIKLIKEYGRKDNNTGILLNHTDGGEGTIGHKHTERYKKFMSERFSGAGSYMYGKPKTEDQKKHLSEINSGINNPNWGRKFSEETLMKKRKPQIKIICPHCLREGGISSMKHYHFENCKFNEMNIKITEEKIQEEQSILNSKIVRIYNSNSELMFTCYRNFKKICSDNKLPMQQLEKSYKNNGSKIYQTAANHKGKTDLKMKQYIGWYAKRG